MTFETLPVVHLETGIFPDYPDGSIEEALTTLARRFGRVVVVDVMGVKRNQPELEILQAAARKRSIWWDAGSRYSNDAMDLFIAGAETVTLRWNTLHRAEELQEAVDLCQPESLLVSLEFPKGTFLTHKKDKRSAETVARHVESLGIGLVYVVDRMDEAYLRSLPVTTTPRYLQGPSAAPIAMLEELGFAGVILPAISAVPVEEDAA